MLPLCLWQLENEISCVLVVCTSIFILPHLSPWGEYKSNPGGPFRLILYSPRATTAHPRERAVIESRLGILATERSLSLYSRDM